MLDNKPNCASASTYQGAVQVRQYLVTTSFIAIALWIVQVSIEGLKCGASLLHGGTPRIDRAYSEALCAQALSSGQSDTHIHMQPHKKVGLINASMLPQQ